MPALMTKTGELIEALKQKPMTAAEISAIVYKGKARAKAMQYIRDLIKRFNEGAGPNEVKIHSRKLHKGSLRTLIYSWGGE
jgi:hypothetical protein